MGYTIKALHYATQQVRGPQVFFQAAWNERIDFYCYVFLVRGEGITAIVDCGTSTFAPVNEMLLRDHGEEGIAQPTQGEQAVTAPGWKAHQDLRANVPAIPEVRTAQRPRHLPQWQPPERHRGRAEPGASPPRPARPRPAGALGRHRRDPPSGRVGQAGRPAADGRGRLTVAALP